MEFGLGGKAAIVTEASKGIGRAIALGLAREGVNVAICARGEAALRATERELAALGVTVLKQYGVTYIIWGPSEQQAYPTASTAILEQVATRVHDANSWVLFQVVP